MSPGWIAPGVLKTHSSVALSENSMAFASSIRRQEPSRAPFVGMKTAAAFATGFVEPIPSRKESAAFSTADTPLSGTPAPATNWAANGALETAFMSTIPAPRAVPAALNGTCTTVSASATGR